jgi:hypothetical protein
MTIADLKRRLHARPFIPFRLVTAKSIVLPISHPDAIDWDEDDPANVVVMVPGGGLIIIELGDTRITRNHDINVRSDHNVIIRTARWRHTFSSIVHTLCERISKAVRVILAARFG